MSGKMFIKKDKWIYLIACIILSFICITITTNNSFLYYFNPNEDMQQFMTAVRCMLKGDILYKDVYEVKGPYLYFLYMIYPFNIKISMYIIELISFFIFLYFSNKAIDLIVNNYFVKLIILLISGVMATCASSFELGGQCEELILSSISITIYIFLRYFERTFPKPMEKKYIIILGIMAGLAFWIKYTFCATYIVLIIFLSVAYLRKKLYREYGDAIICFVLGAFIISVPVVLYFTMNHALKDLWNVYFYDLIFRYKPEEGRLRFVYRFTRFTRAACTSPFTLLGFALMSLGIRTRIKNETKWGFLCLYLGMIGGIMLSRVWGYSTECLQVFVPFGLAYCLILSGQIGLDIVSFLREVNKLDILIYFLRRKLGFIIVVFTLLIIPMRERPLQDKFIITYIAFFSMEVIYRFFCKIHQVFTNNKKMEKFVCFLTFIITNYVVFYLFDSFLLNSSVIFAFVYSFFLENKYNKFLALISQWKQEYFQNPLLFKSIYLGCLMIACCFLCLKFCNTPENILCPIEEYPQYQVAKIINESGIENPKIMYYRRLDYGLYGLTNTDPLCKYISYYNYTNDDFGVCFEKMLNNSEPDFVFTAIAIDEFNANYEKVITVKKAGSLYQKKDYSLR